MSNFNVGCLSRFQENACSRKSGIFQRGWSDLSIPEFDTFEDFFFTTTQDFNLSRWKHGDCVKILQKLKLQSGIP
jgi:hypothetical protein